MAWELRGRYIASCTCTGICNCSTGAGMPTNPDGSTTCDGVAFFNIASGHLDDTRLDGIRWAMMVAWPGLVTDGNWKVGVVIDTEASAAQAKALEEIVSGQHGGPFQALGTFITEFAGVERLPVRITENGGTFGNSDVQFEPLRGADGNPTTMKNAGLGFAPEFELGKGTGKIEVFGRSFQPSYGEAAEYVYSDDSTAHVRG